MRNYRFDYCKMYFKNSGLLVILKLSLGCNGDLYWVVLGLYRPHNGPQKPPEATSGFQTTAFRLLPKPEVASRYVGPLFSP